MLTHNSVAIFATSRFHYQQLAVQLMRHNLLYAWITSLPVYKIPRELRCISKSKPLSLFTYLLSERLLSGPLQRLFPLFGYYSNQIFDHEAVAVVKRLHPEVVVGLSHNISMAGSYARFHDAIFFCDVPIAHPLWLNRVLFEEYNKLGLSYNPIHNKQIQKEACAHHESSKIVCPSSFVKDTLVSEGVDAGKVSVIPYGSAQVSFTQVPTTDGSNDNPDTSQFTVLFVGQLSPRKGISYLLDAFCKFNHPRKSLILAGPLLSDGQKVISRFCLDNVSILGIQSKKQLHMLYAKASVFVLPSVAEGLALVVGEALSYGLPIIYTYESGASEIISHGVEGLMIQSRQTQAVLDALVYIADNKDHADAMRHASLQTSKSLSGWNVYGDRWRDLIHLTASQR